MQISVVIPSKNGLHHMKECLPTVLAAAKKSTVPVTITVVVGDSSDGSMQQAPALFPQVKFLENPKHGASSARNFGVEAAQGEWICFLDNDVFVDEDFFNTVQKYLRPDVFCVACAGYCAYPKKAGAWEQLDGVKLLGWKKGFPRFTQNIYNEALPKMAEYPSWGVQGAYFFCQRSYFDLLGGFDENLDPYMLEETDLVYRGLKRGWKVIYATDTKPRHKCGGTINSKKNKFTQFLSKRNRTWFVWKNVHDTSLCLSHWVRFVFAFSPRLWKECLKGYPVFRQAARHEKSARKKTDLELLEESKAFEHKCNTKEVELQQQKLNIKLGVDYLQARLNRYTHKYTSVNKIATHMMWACFLAAISKKQKVQHNSGPVRICLTIEGGMGDMLMSLNMATAFYKKFCKDKNIEFFVCSYNAPLLPHLSAGLPHFLSQNERDTQVFDLKITCNRTPIVQYANLQRLSADLLGYVEKLLDLEREYKYFLTVPYKDCITQNIVSNLQKRWAQPDLVNEFNLQEAWLLDVPIEQEKETLQKFGLTTKPYITINREVGDTQLVDSTKLWPVEYYRKLVDELKKAAPQYQIVEVGRGKGERVGNTHKNLAGKTSIEEIKVILKNAVLHIDSEGGLVHLRHALKGGPSCVFFGPSSPEVLGYSENINLCSHACPIHCEFYSRTWQETCIKQKHICMNTILPEYALKQIKIKLGL